MPRRPTTHVPEPQQWFSCLVADCPRQFRTISGRTRHINAKHDANDPRHENSAPHIPPKCPQARVNPPSSHDEPNLLDRMSSPPHLDEAESDFQDYTTLSIIDSGDVNNVMPTLPIPPPSSLDSETEEDSIPAIEYHPHIDGVYFLPSSFL
jgi:hypothetical protein